MTAVEAAQVDERCDLRALRLIVVDLPVPEHVVREVLAATIHGGEAPVVIFNDPDRVLDESLIGPPFAHVHHVTGCDPASLPEEILTAYRHLSEAKPAPGAGETWLNWLVGESRPMQKLRALIRLAAPRNSTVLITGETGTGKERVARTIHACSKRSAGPLVTVNCGALPESLIEAELFGHTKGAFTGAVGTRIGRFEQAHKGTLFLDEIGEMPLSLQAKLLRVLQERELQRVGSSETIKVDIRLIAATNVNLEERVAEGRFREDLYYRLNVVSVHVAPLRDRRTDIPLLAQHFLEQVCKREDLPAKTLSKQAAQILFQHDWPGNIRQLEHVIEMAAALSGNRRSLFAGDIRLPNPVRTVQERPARAPEPIRQISGGNVDFESVVGQFEKMLLQRALNSCGGNKAKAASLLGMKRTTLLYKMKAFEDTADETSDSNEFVA